MHIDSIKMSQVVEEAKAKAADHPRWLAAIEKAEREFAENPHFHWNPESQSMLVLSGRSLNLYDANGVCQCQAFQFNQPCWHRAAAKLLKNYFAYNQLAPAAPAQPERAVVAAHHSTARLVKPRGNDAVSYQGWDI